MSAKSTWTWLLIAAGLFAFIFFQHRFRTQATPSTGKILPNLKADAVTTVQVRPGGPAQMEIRAERTNQAWQLTEPLSFPAQVVSIENLLVALEQLKAAAFITPQEIRKHPQADADFGFASPAATLSIWQGEQRTQITVGTNTAPGDQVYVQVVGVDGAYVVDAGLKNYLPRTANDWRDTTLVSLERLPFERIAVTNEAKAFVFQRDATNQSWRMVWPSIGQGGVRADNQKIREALEKLQGLRILQFVSDAPKPDLESFGLAPAELELAFWHATNLQARLQFGHSLSNEANQVYARRGGQDSIFSVGRDALAAWRSPVNDFRDPRLLELPEAFLGRLAAIEVRADDSFTLQRQASNSWQVLVTNSAAFPADALLVKELLSILGGIRIAQFVDDVVNPADLPGYGLISPKCTFALRADTGAPTSSGTNGLLVALSFGLGTNQTDKVFARRSDENSVYAITTNDFARLPTGGWQLRERKLWSFTAADVARLTIRQRGKTRQLVHNGPHQWSLAAGSQGIVEDLATEETVRGLVEASAINWVARGESQRARYGFTEQSLQLTLELKTGSNVSIEFGGEAPSGFPYAAITLDGQPWIFEFPWPLGRDVLSYLSIPAT